MVLRHGVPLVNFVRAFFALNAVASAAGRMANYPTPSRSGWYDAPRMKVFWLEPRLSIRLSLQLHSRGAKSLTNE